MVAAGGALVLGLSVVGLGISLCFLILRQIYRVRYGAIDVVYGVNVRLSVYNSTVVVQDTMQDKIDLKPPKLTSRGWQGTHARDSVCILPRGG